MKIAYLIDSVTALGGIERITLSKASALADIPTNEVYIIVAFHRGEPVSYMNPRIKLINLDVNYYADYGKSRIQAFLFLLKKRQEHIRKLRVFLNEKQPDVLISTNQSEKHFIKSLRLDYRPVFIRELHFCSDYRQIEAISLSQKILAYLGAYTDYHLKTGNLDKVVLLTEEDRIRNWEGRDNVSVIPNPVTMVSNYPPSPLTEKRVIAAGRLVRQKNFASLIRAWKEVQAKHPDWKLDIYGEGSLKTSLEKLIADLRLEGAVCLQGKTQEIFKEMTNSSIFVLSSIYEGFGLVIVEAMSCGLPVVSYACPCGPKDIIEDGKDGFLVEVNDEQTLAARINQLIEDEELRRQMSQAALQKSEKYKMERIIPMWMDLLEKLKREKG